MRQDEFFSEVAEPFGDSATISWARDDYSRVSNPASGMAAEPASVRSDPPSASGR